MICGSGRSGTTALALWVVNSGHFPFVADASDVDSTLEITGINSAVQRRDDAALSKFRRNTQKEYSESFFCKAPTFELVAKQCPDVAAAWQGANLIVMARDPIAVGCREKSVELSTDRHPVDVHLLRAVSRLHTTVIAATELSATMGVALVSYEKLVTNGSDVASQFNEWVGCDGLLPLLWGASVRPNATGYIRKVMEDATLP